MTRDKFTLPLRVTAMYASILEDKTVKEHLEEVRAVHQDSYEHMVRVGRLSMYLGVRNHLCDEQLRNIGEAGTLHDVGKKDIPGCVLCKA